MTRVRRRFRRGQHVRVWDDLEDTRYAGRLGTVLEVVPALLPHYPRGFVSVQLVWPKTYEAQVEWFGRRPPRVVHFAPADLDARAR